MKKIFLFSLSLLVCLVLEAYGCEHECVAITLPEGDFYTRSLNGDDLYRTPQDCLEETRSIGLFKKGSRT